MGNLCASDVKRLVSCCAEIYRWEDADGHSFADHAVRLLPQIVDSAVAAYQSFHFQTKTTELVLSGGHEAIARHEAAFYAHLHEHPLVEHVRVTGAAEPLRITDVVPWSDFEKTGLYNEFYKKVGLTHQLAASLPAAQGDVVGLVFSRAPGEPDFSDRDKEMLDLFRMHVLQAQEIAKRLSALRARLRQAEEMLEAVNDGVASLDATLRIREASQRALSLLEKHFGKQGPRQLPDAVLAWVRSQVTRHAAAAPRCVTVLETMAGVVRLHLVRRGGSWILVIEESVPVAGRPLPDHVRVKLTKREGEVLQWITAGKTNPEIAIILGTSPRTVQKHVEHILQKLNVENRHAAAVRAMEFPG